MPEPAESQPGGTERHRSPALWLALAGVVGALVTAVLSDARLGGLVLVAVLALAAVARLVGRGRRPEGLAVRDTWVDVVVLLVLAGAIAVLLQSTGVV